MTEPEHRGWHDKTCPSYIVWHLETECECGAGQDHWNAHLKAGRDRAKCPFCEKD